MKQNIKYMLLATLLLTASMISCETNELPNIGLADDEIIVEGDTVRISSQSEVSLEQEKLHHPYGSRIILEGTAEVRYQSPQLPSLPKTKPNIESLKTSKNKGELKIFAMGGGITAGVRDFGLFNEGMLTSYPNLVARQMGIEDFKLPLFPASEFNGVGRLVASDGPNYSGGPLPKYRLVTNNVAGKGYDKDLYDRINSGVQVDKYTGETDVFAGPQFTRMSLRQRGVMFTSLNDRFFKGNLESPLSYVLKKDFDLLILDPGTDDLLTHLNNGTISTASNLSYRNEYISKESISHYNSDYSKDQNPEYYFIQSILEKNKEVKIVLLNTPNPLELEYLIDASIVFDNPEYLSPSSELRNISSEKVVYLLPTGQIDSLLSRKVSYALKPGMNKNQPLEFGTLVSKSQKVESINNALRESKLVYQTISEKFNIPVVDIATLYTKVLSKEGLHTEGGLIITSKDFFSLDQMYPTPLGQALIANEVIRTINSFYKVEIPLINIQELKN